MQFILWLAGVFATWTLIKFIFMVFKRIGSKNTMNDILDRMEEGMGSAAETVAGYVQKSKSKKKERKERPMVTIH